MEQGREQDLLEPLVEYYIREMGAAPERLMVARAAHQPGACGGVVSAGARRPSARLPRAAADQRGPETRHGGSWWLWWLRKSGADPSQSGRGSRKGGGMKLAVSGKGGSGKTTLVGMLARQLARSGKRVLACRR